MRPGRPIAEVAAELVRQTATRRDFIAPTPKLRAVVVDEPRDIRLAGLPDFEPLPFSDLAHRQMAMDLAIPSPYYDRMRSQAPHLLADNVNHWLVAAPQDRMVRTLDGRVRAILSSKYRPLDNIDLLAAVQPAFTDLGGGIRVESCEVTERRFYLKAVLPSLQWDLAMAQREALLATGGNVHQFVRDSQIVQAAITISNSEVGEGRLSVEEGIYTLQCLNLATVHTAIKKYHVGRRHGRGDDVGDTPWELLSDETRQADDRAFWLRVRDVVKAVFVRDRFEANVRRLAGAVADPIVGKVDTVVEVTAARYGLSDGTREGILRHLIEGGDLTRFGLINAVTRTSQDVTDYDQATDLERLGGTLIELPSRDWAVLNASNN